MVLWNLQIDGNAIEADRRKDIEQKVMELLGRIEMFGFRDALYAFPEAISLATISCQTAITFLVIRSNLD